MKTMATQKQLKNFVPNIFFTRGTLHNVFFNNAFITIDNIPHHITNVEDIDVM